MGGRGASSEIIKRLPNYKNSIIYKSKITNYVLTTNKSKPFEELGFNNKNFKRLVEQIKEGLKSNHVISKRLNKVGNYNYRIDMKIKGINGKELNIKTIWEVDKNKSKLVSFMKRGK